jgi:hypothetical protein
MNHYVFLLKGFTKIRFSVIITDKGFFAEEEKHKKLTGENYHGQEKLDASTSTTH